MRLGADEGSWQFLSGRMTGTRITDLLRSVDPVMELLARRCHGRGIVGVHHIVNGSITKLDAQKLFVKVTLGS